MSDAVRIKLKRIIDGDTVTVGYRRGWLGGEREDRIRLWGIDAPESEQRGGPEATRQLEKLVGRRRSMWLTPTGTDQYGRTIGILHRQRRPEPDNHNYNYLMVKTGHAHCYMLSGPQAARYREAEREAQAARRGLWRKFDGETPREFRRRQEAKSAGFPWKLILFAAGAGAAAVAALLWLSRTGL